MSTNSMIERVASRAMVAYPRLTLDRRFYAPGDPSIKVETVDPQGTDLDIRYYEQGGNLYGVAFAGKSNKPLWNYRFRDRAQLDRRVEETIRDRKTRAEYMQKRKDERAQFRHSLQVGDILSSSWGYDQTNVNFYQVTAVGERTVKIREIEKRSAPGSGSTGYDNVIPAEGRFKGPEMVKMVSPGNNVRITSYSSASKWSGRPMYETAFGYGH